VLGEILNEELLVNVTVDVPVPKNELVDVLVAEDLAITRKKKKKKYKFIYRYSDRMLYKILFSYDWA
jgi:hypothetical protein